MIRNKKGFTLVELLPVIVILAIILVIAVPQIIKTIDSAREGALVSSAKLIATSAEKEYLARKTLGDTSFEHLSSIPCSDVVKENKIDYKSCTITFDKNGKATVKLEGQGKFSGKHICNGNKTNAEVSADCATDKACFAFDPTEGAITGYNGECGTSIEIPKTIDGVDVVKIGEYAFTSLGEEVTMLSTNKEYSVDYLQNNNSDAEVMPIVTVACEGYGITNVVIPEGITTIGSNAFENNPITSLQLPSSIVEIGYRAFSGNEISGLLDLSSNTNLTVIGSFAFEGDYTTSIKLPLNIETIPMEAFAGMNISGLLDLSGYSNLTTIEKNAFKYNNISEIKLPSSITKIETGAFSKIGNLSNINLTKIINPTGKSFDWDSIIYDNGKGLLNATGTFSGVVVSSS